MSGKVYDEGHSNNWEINFVEKQTQHQKLLFFSFLHVHKSILCFIHYLVMT